MKNQIIPFFLAVIVLSLLLWNTGASALALEELTLENGMQVILLPRPGCGLIASNVFVGSGSTREKDQYAGSSHFLEHLLFNGTTTRTQEEIYAFEDRIGAYNNATTRQEYTHYMMVAPSEKMHEALDLQSDMLLHSILPPAKFEKERGIVIEELVKDNDDPDQRVSSALDSLLHEGDPPFARAVLGTRETIASLPRDAVLEYYLRQYVPSNMRLILMGDFDREDALALIRKLFVLEGDRLPAIPAPSLELSSSGPSTWKTRPVDAPTVTARVSGVLRPTNARQQAALALLVEILGGGQQSRLQTAMTSPPAIETQSVGASVNWMGGTMLLSIESRMAPEADLEALLTRFASALESLDKLDASEVEAAKTRLLSSEISQLEQLHYYALFHGDRLWAMPKNFLPDYLDALEALTTGDLEDYAKETLVSLPLHFTAAGVQVTDEARELSDPLSDPALVELLKTPPENALEVPQRQRPPRLEHAQAPRATLLENGMTLIHSASPDTRMVALHLLVKNRSAREPQDREGIADILHRLLPQTGASALQDRIGAELKVADNPWIPFDDYYTIPLYSFVRLSTTDEFYRESIPYLAWMCHRDFGDSTALDKVRNELSGVLMRKKNSSKELAKKRCNELLYPAHPLSHSTLPSMETLSTVRLDEIELFARDYLAPENLILAIVGDLSYDEALARVCEAFHTHASSKTAEELGPPPPPLTHESKRMELEVGGRQSNLRMGRVVELSPDDRWALQVAVMIASDRMQQDLRETRGMAYRLGISSAYLGGRASIVATMGLQAKNLEEAETAMKGYLSSGILEVSQDEIETVVNSRLGRLRMRTATSMGRAFTLCRDRFLQGDIGAATEEAVGLAAVTPADVARAAERYLSDGPLITVVVR